MWAWVWVWVQRTSWSTAGAGAVWPGERRHAVTWVELCWRGSVWPRLGRCGSCHGYGHCSDGIDRGCGCGWIDREDHGYENGGGRSSGDAERATWLGHGCNLEAVGWGGGAVPGWVSVGNSSRGRVWADPSCRGRRGVARPVGAVQVNMSGSWSGYRWAVSGWKCGTVAGAAVAGRSQTDSGYCPWSPGNSQGMVAGVRCLTVMSGCWWPWMAGPAVVKQDVDPCPPISLHRGKP